jgi:AraC-like DNA-binding protein
MGKYDPRFTKIASSGQFMLASGAQEEFVGDDLVKYAYLAKNFIENDKIYLNPSISLLLIADALKIPPYRLSHAITHYFGKNYHDIINSYRIEHAKKMLLSPDFEYYSIDGIGNESGFGNKTTFYSAFKKYTGTTPAEFRKKSIS